MMNKILFAPVCNAWYLGKNTGKDTEETNLNLGM
jgi:hypothetical protein